MPDAIMLFAAGFGTRMGTLTQTRPKPLIAVAGKPLLDHALDLVTPLGLSRVVVNSHYKADMIAAHLDQRPVQISQEVPDILDTGGGLRHAMPLLGTDPVMTLNTDAIWQGPNPLELLRRAWRPDDMDALLICIPPHSALGHSGDGDFKLDDAGRMTRGPGLVYGGAQIIKTTLLAEVPDRAFSLNVIWNKMLVNNRLFGLPYPGQWCDVGHPDGITLAETLIANV